MGKAKGKTTGKEYLQGADGGGEVESKDPQKGKAWQATVKRPSGDPSDPGSDVDVYGGIVLWDECIYLNFDISLTDDDVITVGENGTDCEEPTQGKWLSRDNGGDPASTEAEADMEIVGLVLGRPRTLGIRISGTGSWLISAAWPGVGGSQIRPIRPARRTKVNVTPVLRFKQEVESWPAFKPKATPPSTNAHTLQFGFDTREYRTLAGGAWTDGGLRVLAAGTRVSLDGNPTTLTRPLDAWGLKDAQLRGAFSLSRATMAMRARNTESATPPVDITGRSLFTATAMKSIAAGTAITYTHKVYYKDNGVVSLLGYLRVEGSSSVTGMSWFVNDAVSMAGGDWALNPNREIQCSPAGASTNITLPAGTWYWCRSTKTSL